MTTDISERPDDMAAPASPHDPYLVVENLSVMFPTHDGLVQAVSDLSYTVERGKTLGIVGESGSGKSVSSMAVLGLHDPGVDCVDGYAKRTQLIRERFGHVAHR